MELLKHTDPCAVYHFDVKRDGEVSVPKMLPDQEDLLEWLRSKVCATGAQKQCDYLLR